MSEKRQRTKEIILYVPEDYNLPTFFNELSTETTAHVLTLASIAYETIKNEESKAGHEQLYASLTKEAAKAYEPQLLNLQKQCETSTSLVSSLKDRLQNETAARIETEKRVRDEERRNREDLLKEKDSRISALESQMQSRLNIVEQTFKDTSRSLTDGFQTFKEQILKTSGSQKKGALGETVFSDFVQRVFGSVGLREQFTLEDVGKEGRQGDLKMLWKNHNILWEVKNYTRHINQDEVNKFHRDMECNPNISLGIMVSLTTGITGHQKTGNIDLEELRDGRICIYINNFLNQDDPTSMLQALKPFMETFLNHRKLLTVDESNEAKQQLERFELQHSILLRLLQNHQDATRKFKNTMANAKKRTDQIWVELSTEMRESEYQVKLLLETILDKSWSTTEANQTETLTIPDYVFRHNEISMYNDKERKFLEDTLKAFTFSEDFTTPSKAVKEVYKGLGYSSDQVDNMRPRVFNDNVWAKGTKDVLYIKPLTQ